MPNIRPSADLAVSYDEISRYCHETKEPVFITNNGRGDLAVMSMDSYDRISSRFELLLSGENTNCFPTIRISIQL